MNGSMVRINGLVIYVISPKGRGNWGTLRICREDWGTLGNIREG